MTSCFVRGARWVLLLACVAGPGFAATPAPDPAVDPAGAWEHLLAHGDYERVNAAFDVVPMVGYAGDAVDADKCRAHAGDVETSLGVAPVSVALWRIAYLCADATGRDADAERALAALGALSRHALAQAGDPVVSRPIRTLVPLDSTAIMATAGLESAYSYYLDVRPARYFRYALVAADEKTGLERHFVFDEVDAAARTHRSNALHGFSALRHQWAEAFVSGGADNGSLAEIDARAVRAAMDATDVDGAMQALRPAADRGGLGAASAWISMCAQKRVTDCEGVVDALLPSAEEGQSLAMTLLAFVQVHGIGTAADAAAGWALLDRANARWDQSGALATFTTMQMQALPDASMPTELEARLDRARLAGLPFARRLAIVRKYEGKTALNGEEVAFLSSPGQNGNGTGYRWLALAAEGAGRKDEAADWTRRAANAGDAYSQAAHGLELLMAGKVDDGMPYLRDAANGGSGWADRMLASRAMRDGKAADAQRWLLGSVATQDVESIFAIASLYATDATGLEGDSKRAIEIYRAFETEPAYAARARRALSELALAGRGMPKDEAQARRWLAIDAGKGDNASRAALGSLLLRGVGGAVDEKEGRRLMQLAIDAGDNDARTELGSWLYYVRNTSESRKSAMDQWRLGADAGHAMSANNYAWARCVSKHADVHAPADGLAMTAKMGAIEIADAAELDTIAACYAANDQYPRAIELQLHAGEVLDKLDAPDDGLEATRKNFAERLALYRAGKPYVEPDRDATP